MSARPHERDGFTLIEMMAVVAMIGFVFFVALNFYTELSRATTRASDHTRDIRRASAILDRVARDIEGAFLHLDPFDSLHRKRAVGDRGHGAGNRRRDPRVYQYTGRL